MSRRPRILFTLTGWLLGLSAGVTFALIALAWHLSR
jgi:hypothetical protein